MFRKTLCHVVKSKRGEKKRDSDKSKGEAEDKVDVYSFISLSHAHVGYTRGGEKECSATTSSLFNIFINSFSLYD